MTSAYDQTLSADAPGATRLDVGTVFADRYEVEALLGAGGMGAVYRVRDATLGETVALKILTLDSPSAVERFLAEVRLARRVTHRNVARTHDLGHAGPVHFLTMEFVPGETLETRLARTGPMPAARVREVGKEIASGLVAAHAAGVVHRDLKPANVLMADDDRVVITDFGIARAVGAEAGSRTVGIVGTPFYMSPEQVSGRPIDERSDIYSLGLMLYELLTGRLPFVGETPLAAAVARLSQPVPDPREHARVPDGLALLVLHCLARDRDVRAPSAQAVLDALDGPAPAAKAPNTPNPSLFAPIQLGSRTLAVLPFAYRGPSEHDFLGEGLAEELIDVLARTRGLRVLSLNATRRFAEARDPREICSELKATAIVDGTLQAGGARVRLAARLLDPEGVQTWSDRFDGSLEDVFALQEKMGQRVAEALRLELDAAAWGNEAPRDAIDLYLRARRDLRKEITSTAEQAVSKLDTVLDLAPDFAPAKALHATAAVRAWWSTEVPERTRDAGERAAESVARAKAEVPALAETHVADAMFMVQTGRFREAVGALARALEIAPTLYEAHEYLGRIQLEAGRAREGRARVELALELNPDSALCALALARDAVLGGDLARFRAFDERLGDLLSRVSVPLLVSRTRWALYRDDLEAARAQYDAIVKFEGPRGRALEALFRPLFADDPLAPEVLEPAREASREVAGAIENVRFATLMNQLNTEVFATIGAKDDAFDALTRCAEGSMIDVEWLALCPPLRSLRGDARFAPLETTIAKRAADIWRR